MTGYGDAEKACSLMALKHLINSTGVVKVLHSNAQLNQNWRMEKKKKRNKPSHYKLLRHGITESGFLA